MHGWIQRGLTLLPPSGPLPYPRPALQDSSANTMNVIKPSATGLPMTLGNMAAQPVRPVRQVPIQRGFAARFKTSEVPNATADDALWEVAYL